MKSKKLFAILTLVAFMMTLVPAMAFGATDYSASSSYVDVDKESVKADGTAKATITVVFRDVVGGQNRILVNTAIEDFYVRTSRDAETIKVIDKNGSANLTIGPKLITAVTGKTTNADGEIDFEVSSSLAGKSVISFWKDSDAEDVFIDEVEINFTASSTTIASVAITHDDGDNEVAAGDEVEFTATVTDGSGNGVSGKTVTFYKRAVGGSWVSFGTAQTNRLGKAELEYTETKADAYEIKAKCGSKETASAGYADLEVLPGEPVKVVAVTADGKNYDVDSDTNTVKFEAKDYYGNNVTVINGNEAITAAFVSAPSDSDKDGDPLSYNVGSPNADDEIVFDLDFDEIGDYQIKAKARGTGIFTLLNVKAVEAGDTEDIIVKFQKDSRKSLIAGDEFGVGEDELDYLVLDVKYVDENGIEVNADDFKAYSSDVSLVKIASSNTFDDGTLKIEGPKDEDKRGEVTITVVDLATGAVASLEVPVVGEAYAIETSYSVSAKTAAVSLQFVDDEGAVTATRDADEDYEILLPEGVEVSDKEKFDKDSGVATFDATVDEYGTYEITVVSESGIAKKFTIAVGEPADEKTVDGAVTMFIGSTGYVVNGVPMINDVAPFIKDGRTFVAVRPLANAFGVAGENIGWDEATGTVTLTRDDITVTIVIGSNDIEVVEDGVVTTVTADVAAFIENGRTVLPFRAVGEAFGAIVSWDEATQSVTYEL